MFQDYLSILQQLNEGLKDERSFYYKVNIALNVVCQTFVDIFGIGTMENMMRNILCTDKFDYGLKWF